MNYRHVILSLAALINAHTVSAELTTGQLRCEYLAAPLGLDATAPRLSWQLNSTERGSRQSAYQILVASTPERLAQNQGDLWDSGQVPGAESLQVAYAGQSLSSRQICYWKVRVWDQNGAPQAWSAPSQWQMGLLLPTDWQAEWISDQAGPSSGNTLIIKQATYGSLDGHHVTDVTAVLRAQIHEGQIHFKVGNHELGGDPAHNSPKHLVVDYQYDGIAHRAVIAENHSLILPDRHTPPPYLRKSFTVHKPVRQAVLYATALGLYEMHLNGQRVGDHQIAPDWTDYRHRIRYQAYDVTAQLQAGKNALGALIADGWYSGHIGNGGFEFFGDHPALLAQLEITYTDGTQERVATDRTWKLTPVHFWRRILCWVRPMMPAVPSKAGINPGCGAGPGNRPRCGSCPPCHYKPKSWNRCGKSKH